MNQSDQPPQGPGNGGESSEPTRAHHLSARVPESVSRGVFSSGVVVMTGGSEFILDFVQNLGQPPQVAARVVMPHATLPQFIEALRTNLGIYMRRFGQPPALPRGTVERQPTAQEIYDELKIRDDVLCGAYANGVMIGHSASEFKFDFLTNLFPTTAVSARVYLSAPQVPRLLDSLTSTYQQFQQRVKQQREQQRGTPGSGPDPEPPPPPAAPPTGEPG
jgi:hypothetical protein